MIPNLAIHMNREANNGTAYNPQKDMLPLFAAENTDRTLLEMIAEQVGADRSDILSHDLFLYNRMPGTIWGADREFVSSARLDDLQCAFSSMEGLLGAETKKSIAVHCVLDNEEVGSGTKQGAASTFLKDTLLRINTGLGRTYEEYLMTLENGSSTPLKHITSDYHYHTVAADSKETLDFIQDTLKEKGFLAELRDFEPVEFPQNGQDAL